MWCASTLLINCAHCNDSPFNRHRHSIYDECFVLWMTQHVFILFMLHFNNIVNLRKRCFTSVNIAANVFVNCIMAIVIWPTPHKCKWHCNGTTVLKTLICVTCVPLCAFVPIDIKLIVQSATPLSRGCVCIVLLFRGASEPVLMKQNRTKTCSVKCYTLLVLHAFNSISVR